MASILGKLFGALGGGDGGGAAAAEDAESSEHKGYTVTPAPRKDGGQWVTAGTIAKEIDGTPREHEFIRADRHTDRDEAIAYSRRKACQIIDEQGDAIFRD